MGLLLKYALSDGLITGLWNSNTPALLEAQRIPGDPTYGYAAVSDRSPLGQLGPEVIQERWAVPAGVPTPKATHTLTASPNPFDADGVAVCSITLSPFVACTLLVNGTPYALTTGDQTLALTSDTPLLFRVVLAPLASAWAPPITVEAV